MAEALSVPKKDNPRPDQHLGRAASTCMLLTAAAVLPSITRSPADIKVHIQLLPGLSDGRCGHCGPCQLPFSRQLHHTSFSNVLALSETPPTSSLHPSSSLLVHFLHKVGLITMAEQSLRTTNPNDEIPANLAPLIRQYPPSLNEHASWVPGQFPV
ncbi:hypothetical protein AOQ84DRAFT_6654 [Glonium stellatum]|uniref:Uncharacterized protein n=1 Tax=Glonium stellatum TaxID=574774 RepID=A0A8E2F539_9PEZI|nr:hypothetical protein AOQ84DRAFT_6654 [Glonium stellatum]